MGCFVLVGFAFGVHHPEALICGYVVATLFAMISFVPQGVGVVEAAVTVAFALFGVDSATGLAVVMVYRGIVFWLPFLVGAFVIQRMRAFVPSKKKIEGAMAQDLNSAVSGQAAALEEASEAFAAEPAGISTTSMEVEPAAMVGKPAAVAGEPVAATASQEAESSVAADAPKEGTRSAKAPELAK